MAVNERQADFWDGLQARLKGTDAEFTAKDLAYWARIGERQARRVMDGSGLVTVDVANLIVCRAPEPIADAFTDYILEGSERMTIDVTADAGDFDDQYPATLRALADLHDARREAAADNVITSEEADKLIACANNVIRGAIKLKVYVDNAPRNTNILGGRQAAKPLKMADSGK